MDGEPPKISVEDTADVLSPPITSPITGQVLEFKPSQSAESRLAEYITGYPEEQWGQLIGKMELDYRELVEEYGLPPYGVMHQKPAEYLKRLREVAEKYKVPIKSINSISEDSPEKLKTIARAFPAFYDDESGAVYLKDPDSISVDDLHRFLHELVHGLDDRKEPKFPLEQMEYRAYLAELGNVQAVANTLKEDFVRHFFGDKVGASCRLIYRTEKNQSPPWEGSR